MLFGLSTKQRDGKKVHSIRRQTEKNGETHTLSFFLPFFSRSNSFTDLGKLDKNGAQKIALFALSFRHFSFFRLFW